MLLFINVFISRLKKYKKNLLLIVLFVFLNKNFYMNATSEESCSTQDILRYQLEHDHTKRNLDKSKISIFLLLDVFEREVLSPKIFNEHSATSFFYLSDATASPRRYTCDNSVHWQVMCLDFYFI